MVYRLTERYCGAWHDIVEGGETFDYETEEDIRRTLDSVGWHTGHGYAMNYREVTDEQLEEERRHYANVMTAMMMGE